MNTSNNGFEWSEDTDDEPLLSEADLLDLRVKKEDDSGWLAKEDDLSDLTPEEKKRYLESPNDFFHIMTPEEEAAELKWEAENIGKFPERTALADEFRDWMFGTPTTNEHDGERFLLHDFTNDHAVYRKEAWRLAIGAANHIRTHLDQIRPGTICHIGEIDGFPNVDAMGDNKDRTGEDASRMFGAVYAKNAVIQEMKRALKKLGLEDMELIHSFEAGKHGGMKISFSVVRKENETVSEAVEQSSFGSRIRNLLGF